MSRMGRWEVVLSDEASMFPQGFMSSDEAVAIVEFILAQQGGSRYVVGVKPAGADALVVDELGG